MPDIKPQVLRTCAALLCALLATVPAQAQDYSYDGNIWYEVEVSIFTNDYPLAPNAERTAPDQVTASYLPRLRQLQSRSDSFSVPFPRAVPELAGAEPTLALDKAEALPELLPEPPLVGPLFSPAVKGGFKIADFDRDPYLDLDAAAGQFTALNRRLAGAADHRLLWHKLWRQPMQGQAQTPAIHVSGGDPYGDHTELEGSLRLSDSGGRVMLNIDIWLNRFARDLALDGETWSIPAPPFLPDSDMAEEEPLAGAAFASRFGPFAGEPATPLAPAAPTWNLVEVWQLAEGREVGAAQLHYLDHPALGVLIEIRPYQLPERVVAEDEEDF